MTNKWASMNNKLVRQRRSLVRNSQIWDMPCTVTTYTNFWNQCTI